MESNKQIIQDLNRIREGLYAKEFIPDINFLFKNKKWEALPPTLNWSHFIKLLSIKNENEFNL